MSHRRTSTVFIAAALMLAAVLTLFVVELERGEDRERREVTQRFEERASVSAALTESLFSSTSDSTAAELRKSFGGERIDEDRLRARAAQGNTAIAIVIDRRRRVLGSTERDPALVQRLVADPSVQRVLDGAKYALSDHIEQIGRPRGDGLLYVLRYPSSRDGDRLHISGFGTDVLSGFLGAYLARIPDAGQTSSYVLDSKGVVIGSPVRAQRPGTPVGERGLLGAIRMGTATEQSGGVFGAGDDEKRFTSVPVANSTWSVVLTTRSDGLFAGVDSSTEWTILAALALAGLLALILLVAAIRASNAVGRANLQLAGANADLGRSNDELQRSNAELAQFASVASHDLQEPLRKVQMFGDQLERRHGAAIPEEGLDYLRRMRAAARRMSELIEDLLHLSRVTSLAAPAEDVDLRRVAQDVVGDLEATIGEAGAQVEIGALPVVRADPFQMRQLLQNLIVNAVKFRRPGEAPVVTVAAGPLMPAQPGLVTFTVTDNGIGIEADQQERVFEIFERLHSTDVYEGTGIGLALCRKIAERHGGSISLSSQVGRGSTFTITLPEGPDGRDGRDGEAPGRALTGAEA